MSEKEIREMNIRGIIVICLAVGGFILGVIAKAI